MNYNYTYYIQNNIMYTYDTILEKKDKMGTCNQESFAVNLFSKKTSQ